MPVLNDIVRKVDERLQAKKRLTSLESLKEKAAEQNRPLDFKRPFLEEGLHIIAEIKFRSPTQGVLKEAGEPEKIAAGYVENGACALSILTEPDFFGGSLEHLAKVRRCQPQVPLLRKDFITDPYQVHEARAYGADAVLLICSLLTPGALSKLMDLARELGMCPLVEVHTEREMESALKLRAGVIGVNNRNLKSMRIDLETSVNLAKMVPSETLLISESGLSRREDLLRLQECGYRGFLIGSHFMRRENPGLALKAFFYQN